LISVCYVNEVSVKRHINADSSIKAFAAYRVNEIMQRAFPFLSRYTVAGVITEFR
jgi:hypothetical protein